MNRKPYLIISAVIFALVGLMHLLRAFNGWEFRIGDWSVAAATSWVAGLVAVLLSIWGFRLAGR